MYLIIIIIYISYIFYKLRFNNKLMNTLILIIVMEIYNMNKIIIKRKIQLVVPNIKLTENLNEYTIYIMFIFRWWFI